MTERWSWPWLFSWPWRLPLAVAQASTELLRHRCSGRRGRPWPPWQPAWPSACAASSPDRLGLGAFAPERPCASWSWPARRSGWAGLVGRANGGMIVTWGGRHPVAFRRQPVLGHRAEFRLAQDRRPAWPATASPTRNPPGASRNRLPWRRACSRRQRVMRPALSEFPFAPGRGHALGEGRSGGRRVPHAGLGPIASGRGRGDRRRRPALVSWLWWGAV